MNMINVYTDLLLRKPYSTKMITSFVTFGLGDVLTQMIERNAKKKKGKKWKFQFARFMKQAIFGVLAAPYLHIHFAKVIPTFIAPIASNPNKKVRVLKSLLYDQTIHACFFTVVYFLWLNMVNSTGFPKALENTKGLLWPTMIANWKLWPAAMLINYSVIPQHYSVTYVNIIVIFWNAYISMAFNRQKSM